MAGTWRQLLAGGGWLTSFLFQERVIDLAQPINQGVTGDRVVKDRRGLRVREITFQNPCDGRVYVHLTAERTLEPGLLVLLYKTRWEIEKVFDETKTELQEQQSWATTTTPKEMQARFVALGHNHRARSRFDAAPNSCEASCDGAFEFPKEFAESCRFEPCTAHHFCSAPRRSVKGEI